MSSNHFIMFITHKFYDIAASEGAGASVKTNEQIINENKLREQLGQELLSINDGSQKLSILEKEKLIKQKENSGGLTQEQIDAEAQKLIADRAAAILADEEKEKQRLRDLDKAGKETPAVVKIKSVTTIPEKKKVNNKEEDDDTDDLDEVELLKKLSKKAGREIKSLDEIFGNKELTKEEIEAKEQERENKKLEFALQNKKITKAEIESFINDTKNPSAVAYEFFAAQQLELDDTLSEKDIRQNFEERYSLDVDVESPAYKLGQKELAFISNNIIAKKHAKYIGIENDFSNYENEIASTEQRKKEIAAKTPAYKKDIQTVLADISKLKIAGYEIEIDDDVIKPYGEKLLNPENSEPVISKGYTIENLKDSVKNSMILDNLEIIIQGILDADRLRNQAGARGVVPDKNISQRKVYNEVDNEKIKELENRLGVQQN